MGRTEENFVVYQYHPDKGFVQVDCVNQQHTSNYAYEEPIFRKAPKYLVSGPVLLISKGFSNWEGQESAEWNYGVLFPDVELPF